MFWMALIMKRLFVLALVWFLGIPVLAADKQPAPVIRPMNRVLDDVGCVFNERRGNAPILITSPSGNWMHIDGQERQLTVVESTDESDYGEYQTGDYRIRIHYGPSKMHEGGASYRWSKITVTRQGRMTQLKVKGGCGC